MVPLAPLPTLLPPDDSSYGFDNIADVLGTSPALLGSASELTDARGHYQLDNLPAGDYQVTVYYGESRQPQHVHVDEGAYKSKSFVRCDALPLDEDSVSSTMPYMEVGEKDAQIGHEATVSKVGDDQLFYLMSRGLSEQQAMSMIVNGFIEPVTRTLPMEYAVEWSRLIELQMEGSVG